MGFIPLPLGVVMLRVVYTSVKSTNPGAWAVVAMAYLCLLTFRILGSIVILGKACDLIEEHQGKAEERKKPSTSSEQGPLLGRPVVEEVVGGRAEQTGADLFSLPSDPAEHRKLSEVTDVILVKMNSAMKEIERGQERLSEGEESSYCSSMERSFEEGRRQGVEEGRKRTEEERQEVKEGRKQGVIRDSIEDVMNGNVQVLVNSNGVLPVSTRDRLSECELEVHSKDNHVSSEHSRPVRTVVSRESLSTTLPAESSLSGELEQEEAEAILRYRTLSQRSMSSPDLVLEGLGAWQGRGESGGEA